MMLALRNYKDSINENKLTNKQIIIFIVSCVVLSRILLYLTFVFSSLAMNRSMSLYSFFMKGINVDQFCDCTWYKSIMEYGYGETPRARQVASGAQNYAFFPLMPMLIKGLHYIIPIEYYILGSIVNTIILGFTCYYFYKYILLTRSNTKIALFAIILLTFGPYSWYCSALMTESLFMLLLALSLYFLKQEKYIQVGITGFLLSATRNTGVFFVFVIFIHSIKKYIREKNTYNTNKFFGYFKFLLNNEKLVFAVCLIPVSFIT